MERFCSLFWELLPHKYKSLQFTKIHWAIHTYDTCTFLYVWRLSIKCVRKKKNPPYERVGGAMRKALLVTLRLGSWGKFPREGDAGLVFPAIPALALGMDSGRQIGQFRLRNAQADQEWGYPSTLSKLGKELLSISVSKELAQKTPWFMRQTLRKRVWCWELSQVLKPEQDTEQGTRPSLPTQTRQRIRKQRYDFANTGLSCQSYGFSSSHVWILRVGC